MNKDATYMDKYTYSDHLRSRGIDKKLDSNSYMCHLSGSSRLAGGIL